MVSNQKHRTALVTGADKRDDKQDDHEEESLPSGNFDHGRTEAPYRPWNGRRVAPGHDRVSVSGWYTSGRI